MADALVAGQDSIVAEVPASRRGSRLHLAPLPTPLTPFVGREREIGQLIATLRRPEVRLVTVTGPGGVGKTRVAIQAARDLAADPSPGSGQAPSPGSGQAPSPGSELAPTTERGQAFPDGIAFVGLASVREAELVLPTIAQALGVREAGNRPLPESLAASLRALRVLLVLDNLEHLVAASPAIAALLTGCPDLKILATSRAPLRISAEHEHPLPPLSLRRGDGETGRQEEAAPLPVFPPSRLPVSSEAVRLFVARARAVRPDFALDETNAAAAVEICRRLDCLPLAIELAAARLRHMPPAVLLARLEHRLPLLTGGPHDQPDRHRTLHDTIAWSYDLLPPAEQAIFRRLSVFAGGFTLDAAEAVAQGDEGGEGGRRGAEDARPLALPSSPSVLDAIAGLIDQGLVTAPPSSPSLRYGMLETIREFGQDALTRSSGAAAARQRHADYFLDLVERAWPAVSARVDHEPWLARLAAEHDNLRGALAWLVERGEAEAALRLAGGLYWFWLRHGHLSEGRRWLERALAMPDRRTTTPQARALVLLALATLVHFQGDDAVAVPLTDEALALARQAGSAYVTAMSLLLLGTIREDQGRYADALPPTEEALARCRAMGHRANAALCLFHLAVVTWGLGDLDRAVDLGEETLAENRAIGDPWGTVVALSLLGLIVGLRGELRRAVALLGEGLRLGRACGAQREVAACLANAAVLAALAGEAGLVARLFGGADAVRAVVGSDWKLPERAVYEETIAAARAAIGEPAFAEGWATGRAASLDDTIELVGTLAALPSHSSPVVPVGPGRLDRLSAREREVLRLVAEGRTNAEIAGALFITSGTARIHVSNILAKLGARTRTEAAAIGRAHGLL